MTKKKTTTPTNKDNTAAKAKLPKSKKGPPITISASDETADSETSQGAPLKATLGDQLKAKGDVRTKEVSVENFERRLPCQLTDSQCRTRIKQAQMLSQDIEREQQEIENAKKEFDGKKKTSESRIAQLEAERANVIREGADGVEYRSVSCQRVRDWKLGEVRELRIDTVPPTIIDQRAMTATERQTEIDYDAYATSKPSPMQAQSTSGEDADVTGDDGSGIVDDDYGSEDINVEPGDFE